MAITTGVGSPLKGVGGRNAVVEMSFEDVARRTRNASTAFSSPSARSLGIAGNVVAGSIERAAKAKGITNFAGKPWQGYRVRVTKVRSDPYVIIRPSQVGATAILDSGAQPHVIGARALGTKRSWRNNPTAVARRRRVRSAAAASAKQAIFYAGLPRPVAYVRHPGMQGKNFVNPGANAGFKVATQRWNTDLFAEVVGSFTGKVTR